MINKCNVFKFVALVIFMLMSVVNTWALNVVSKERIPLTFKASSNDGSWNSGYLTLGWNGAYNNLQELDGFTNRNLSSCTQFELVTHNLTAGEKYRLFIIAVVNGEEKKYSYTIENSDNVTVPLSGDGWLENGQQITMNAATMLSNVKSLSFGGTYGANSKGSVVIEKLFLCRSRKIEADANGILTLNCYDYEANENNLERNGDYINKSQAGWVGLGFSFDETDIETEWINVDASIYNGASEDFFNSLAVNYSGGTQYLGKNFNQNISISKISSFEVVLYGTGAMHVRDIKIKLKKKGTVSFNSNGGSSCASIDCYQAGVTLPSATNSGDYLLGWFDSAGKFVGYPGDKYFATGNITLKAEWRKVTGNSTQIGDMLAQGNNMFSFNYPIDDNNMYTFTFRNKRNSERSERWSNWSLWCSSEARSMDVDKAYFYMDLAPCVRKNTSNDGSFWNNYESTTVYYKNNGTNGLTKLSEDADWQKFLSDMADAQVTVKVYNYNGKVRVYAVMVGSERTYVYPYEYTKFDNAGRIHVFFSVDHAILTGFTATKTTGIAVIGGNVQYNGTSDAPKNCTVSFATEEGYPLQTGSLVTIGDKVVVSANASTGWAFQKWQYVNVNEFKRNITIAQSHVDNHSCSPTAVFGPRESTFNIAENRVFFLDFEGITQGDLLPESEAPTGAFKDGDVTTRRFYNYGTEKSRGKLMKHPTFGQYYQNLPNSDEFTESKSENFLRVVLTDQEKTLLNNICFYSNADGTPDYSRPKPEGTKSATIGFWINAKQAIDYELPLERGSMFCILSNERTLKADDELVPRYMFDISCNGWTYAYMPNSYSREVTDENGNTTTEAVNLINRFTYGETAPVVDNPKTSLFGTERYENAQNQLKKMFYNDKEWHYITYVATNDLKTITMYVDGVQTGTLDTNSDDVDHLYEDGGDYPGRVYYLRNLVLGGFTPHGLFFGKQYYSDAALAYDDISIYSEALTTEQINAVMSSKHYRTDNLIFPEMLASLPTGSTWHNYNGISNIKSNSQPITTPTSLVTGMNDYLFTAEAADQIFVSDGLLGLKAGASIIVPDVPKNHCVMLSFKYAEDGSATPEFSNNEMTKLGIRTMDKNAPVYAVNYRANLEGSNSYTFKVPQGGLWFYTVAVTPYEDVKLYYEPENSNIVRTYKNVTPGTEISDAPSLKLYFSDDEPCSNLSNLPNGASIKYTSSAPLVANVDNNGKVTLTGLPGEATINAEILSDRNAFDPKASQIKTSFVVRVNAPNNTYALGNGDDITVGKTLSTNSNNIIVTAGGWEYNDGNYAVSKSDNVTDGWGTGAAFNAVNDANPIDGFKNFVQGKQNAMSENYGMGDDFNSTGRFEPATSFGDGKNVKPWTLPCRGSYVKVQPTKAGVVSMYILQNGNLGNEVVENQGKENEKKWCTTVNWRPVYVTDETGRIIDDVRVTSNSNISPYDNFFREGRRRAQFILDTEDTWNQKLKESMKEMLTNYPERFETLRSNWNNANWKQRVIPSGDGGYMIMSKGMVRYTFNVLPGKTYYIFSNVTKIGISGYTFEEGKLLGSKPTAEGGKEQLAVASSESKTINDEHSTSVVTSTKDQTSVTYKRGFTANKWSSICLPFSMNNKQMKEIFGNDTKVILLKQIYPEGNTAGKAKGSIEFVYHVNQDIIAGYPYLILPSKDVTSVTVNAHFEASEPLFSVGSTGATLQYGATYNDESILKAGSGDYANAKNDANAQTTGTSLAFYENYPYVFEGCFVSKELPLYSYAMSASGNLTRLTASAKVKPFRAYLKCENPDAASRLTSMSFDEVEDDNSTTTSIEELLQESGVVLNSSDVYGIDGKVVREDTHSLEGLKKGIYIVNGKKYVVK